MKDATPHHSVRIVLLNQHDEVLLMKAADPQTTEPNGTYNGDFWFLIGGEIEPSEDTESAIFRELKEETNLDRDQVDLGPEIWFGDFELILSGKKRHMKQRFFLARTTHTRVSPTGLTEAEKKIVRSLEWFSEERLRVWDEPVYPVGLYKYL